MKKENHLKLRAPRLLKLGKNEIIGYILKMKNFPNLESYNPVIPNKFKWAHEHALKNGPKIMIEAFKTYGITEIYGTTANPEIIEMAQFLGGVIADFYTSDEIPWCGLAVSYWIKKAGFEPPKNFSQVRARDFANWGKPVKTPSFGDIMVFWRGSRQGRDGHVGLYIGENNTHYFILGGNQKNQIGIDPIAKVRLLEARRCPGRLLQPRGVVPFMNLDIQLRESVNEL